MVASGLLALFFSCVVRKMERKKQRSELDRTDFLPANPRGSEWTLET